MEMGNQPLASCSVGTASATRWQCCSARGPCFCRGDRGQERGALCQGQPVLGRGGGPSAGPGVSWVGCRHLRRRELLPPSETLSSVFLHFQDDSAQHRINSELNSGKKGLRDFWFCFSQDSPGLLLVLPMTGVHDTTPGASVGRKFLSF